jgi:hypothetical protein
MSTEDAGSGIVNSCAVFDSKGVIESGGVNGSCGVYRSCGVNYSEGVSGSSSVNLTNGVNGSFGVNLSNGVNVSYGVNRSGAVSWSYGVDLSTGVSNSYGLFNCRGVSYSIFDVNRKTCPTIFGKKVSEKRFEEVFDKIKKLSNGWYPEFNNIKSLYLKNGSNWVKTPIKDAVELSAKEAWSGMPKELLEYIKNLPEFDADIFFEVTGIDLRCPKTIKISHEGREFEIDVEKAKELGVIK